MLNSPQIKDQQKPSKSEPTISAVGDTTCEDDPVYHKPQITRFLAVVGIFGGEQAWMKHRMRNRMRGTVRTFVQSPLQGVLGHKGENGLNWAGMPPNLITNPHMPVLNF